MKIAVRGSRWTWAPWKNVAPNRESQSQGSNALRIEETMEAREGVFPICRSMISLA